MSNMILYINRLCGYPVYTIKSEQERYGSSMRVGCVDKFLSIQQVEFRPLKKWIAWSFPRNDLKEYGLIFLLFTESLFRRYQLLIACRTVLV